MFIILMMMTVVILCLDHDVHDEVGCDYDVNEVDKGKI